MIKKNLLIILLLVFLLLPIFTKKGYCAKVVPLPDLKKAGTILVDDNQLYITEEASVHIYSLKDFKLKKVFGQRGEGPGEFRITLYRGLFLLLRSNYLVVDSYGRISYFTKDGQFKSESKIYPSMGKYTFLGDKLMGLGFKQYDKLNYFTFTIYDFKAKNKKETYRYKHPYQHRQPYNPLETTRMPSYVTYDNKFYLRGEKNTILVFDDNGKPLAPIRFPYKEVKFTEKHKNYYITWYKTDPKFKPIYERDKRWIQFPDYFPVIRNFMISDGKLYVLTYRKKDGKYELLLLTLEGQLQHQIFVPLKDENAFRLFPYTIKNGILYQAAEDEDEEIWKLHIHPVSGPQQVRKK